jgi:hypothetical protein
MTELSKRVKYLAHCVWLWMDDFFGEGYILSVDLDRLIALLKEAIEYRDENGQPCENPWGWVFDELNDSELDNFSPFNMPAEVLEIVKLLCREDMTLAIEVLNAYKDNLQTFYAPSASPKVESEVPR